ncbi:MAG: tetratricopeptide repeat protein, partial [Xanthobacteraceae bacterium]|nr:tetratricopeptide repeat protein [Xanthobacteraceae bacterium]
LTPARAQDGVAAANPLVSQARTRIEQHRYDEAAELYQRALAILEKEPEKNRPYLIDTLSNLARTYEFQSRYTDAVTLRQRAVALGEATIARDKGVALAASLNDLGIAYYLLGRYAEAEPLDERALAIRENALGRNHRDVAISLNNLARIYERLGRYDEAEALHRRAIAIEEKAAGAGRELAVSLNNLALVDLKVGRPAEAEQLTQRALALQQKILPPGDADLAHSLNNLAVAYRQLGRAADGEPLLKRAIAIKERIFGPEHPEVAFHLIPLANAYVNLGRYQEAEPLYLRALDIRLKVFGPDHMDVASVINYLARLQLLMGRTTESIDSSRRAVRLVVDRLNRDAGSRTAPEIASLRDYFDQNIAVLQRASEERILGTEAGTEAFESAQWANQSTAATALAQMAARFGAASDPLAVLAREQQDAVAELRILDRALPAEIAKPENQRDRTREEAMRRHATELAATVERLDKEIAAKFPQYASLVSPKPIAVARVQELLGEDEALVFFLSSEADTQVFAVSRERFVWKTIPLGAQAVAAKVTQLRQGLDVNDLLRSIDAGQPVLFNLGVAYELYQTLLAPVDDVIKAKRHLLAVPTGALTALPFHVLVTGRPPVAAPPLEDAASYRNAAWLVKRQAVSILPSVESLQALRAFARTSNAPLPMTGYGDPVFKGGAPTPAPAQRGQQGKTRAYTDYWRGATVDRSRLSQALPQLDDTADELKAVAAKLGAATSEVHLRQEASETAVKRAKLADYRVIYFATHGLVAGEIKDVA